MRTFELLIAREFRSAILGLAFATNQGPIISSARMRNCARVYLLIFCPRSLISALVNIGTDQFDKIICVRGTDAL
jgi:hypothetical protein